jgi:hypothetical protein
MSKSISDNHNMSKSICDNQNMSKSICENCNTDTASINQLLFYNQPYEKIIMCKSSSNSRSMIE